MHYKYFASLHLNDDDCFGSYDKNFLEESLNENPNICYWCFAEHVSPIGQNFLYVFLHYYREAERSSLWNDLHNNFFKVHLVSKPSGLYRKYIKDTGFNWNLGKSKPIPGTFSEKKGGL